MGRRIAGQPFAHQQADGRRQRYFVSGLRTSNRIRPHPHLERMAKVRAHTGHALGAHRLNPGRLDCIEHRACSWITRTVGGVNGVVVMPKPQRHPVGKSARFRHLVSRQRAPGHRHAKILAALGWRIGGKGQLHLRLARHGPRGTGQHGFKGVERRLFGHDGQALAANSFRCPCFGSGQ